MSVQYFLSQEGQLQDSSPATIAKRNILQRLQQELQDNDRLYTIIVAPDSAQKEEVCADVLILSDHGMGIMNLRHESGSVSREGDVWMADGVPLTVDTRQRYRNPHEKLQQCAEKIREKLMNPSEAARPWLQGRYLTWQDLFFDTAICFTQPEADIEYFRKYYAQDIREGQHVKEWERFTLLKLEDLSRWATSISFESDIEDRFGVQSYRLTSSQVFRIVTDFFHAAELTELPEPTVAPGDSYGYMLLKEYGEVIARYQLNQQRISLGRDPSCDILIPRNFTMVSRVHAILNCSPHGVTIEDSSRNGTFVNGVRAQAPTPLSEGQEVLLGGNKPIRGVCILEFSATPPDIFVDWD